MPSVALVARPPDKPILIFDGDCAFCRRWIARWKQTTGDRVDYLPLQSDEIASRFPELPREQLESAVHFVDTDGRVTLGAEAVFRSLAVASRWPLWCYENIPGVAPLTGAAYRVVASNRKLASWATSLLWGERLEQPTYFLVRWLFLRLLGATYLIAFLSFNSQMPGLIGSNGIIPAQSVMTAVEENTRDLGPDRFRAVPTIFWFGTSDRFLRQACLAGVGLSALVILNLAPAPCLLLLWLLYLSIAQVGTVFLGFQWDNLLLETGLLAVFIAPKRLWPNLPRESPPSPLILWLLRWLLFRLMFSSGVVKWLSGDPAWHNLTALTVHFETQPLPTPLAWHAHHWPLGIQKGLCGAMFFIEIIVPFLIFLPRRPRRIAFWLFVPFMIAIALTGNYTFFNWLTCVLCLLLLDDFALVRFAPASWSERVGSGPRPAWWRPLPRPLQWTRNLALATFGFVTIAVTSIEMIANFHGRVSPDNPLVRLSNWAGPFRSFNSYGLFRVMTTSRPEIVVEGSNDARNWLPYEFRYKPGDVNHPPPIVAPHQPRLDWQMWFAALGNVRANPWFVNFCFRLLQAKPDVLALIEKNPFPGRPPKFIRAVVYDYHFTTPEERAATGAWWRREYQGEYCPAISLERANAPGAP